MWPHIKIKAKQSRAYKWNSLKMAPCGAETYRRKRGISEN
jgi:hypothetical protein